MVVYAYYYIITPVFIIEFITHQKNKFLSAKIQRNILKFKSKFNYHFTHTYAKIDHVDMYNERRNSLEETKIVTKYT